jgi:hypothetical protein
MELLRRKVLKHKDLKRIKNTYLKPKEDKKKDTKKPKK